MITAIEIENFKCFGERVRIDFAPITLLFGPNSAGKTTIFETLLFLHEVFTTGELDVATTTRGGPSVDLGGFRDFVHLRETRRPISIRLEIRSNGGIPEPLAMGWNEEMDPWNIIGDWGPVGVEITIQWSEAAGRPFVTSYQVDIDRIWIARLTTSSDGRQTEISAINWVHPRFLPEDEDHLTDLLEVINRGRRKKGEFPIEVQGIKHDPVFPNLKHPMYIYGGKGFFVDGEMIPHDCPEAIQLSDFADAFEEAHPGGCSPLALNIDVSYCGLPLDVFLFSDDPRIMEDRRVWLTLTHIFWGSGELIRRELADLLYLGPLREVPGRGFRPSSRLDRSRWPSGLAAWDQLYQTGIGIEVDQWLSSPQKLDTGYKVELKRYRKLRSNSRAMVTFETGGMLDDPGQFQEEIVKLRELEEIVLIEKATGLETQPSDVGTGISQVLPVVVAALKNVGIRCIEQPELHIHPRLQVNLGDLFICALTAAEQDLRSPALFDPFIPPSNSTGQFILETHSEHLLLRLLRRVRETCADELEPGLSPVWPAGLSINYFEPGPTGTTIRRLEVNEDGDFSGDWPEGFFQERKAELF